MMDFKTLSVKVSNYKCFAEEPQGFEKILPINLIIGRNNSGKSTLLDLIEYTNSPSELYKSVHNNKTPKILLATPLDEYTLRQVFPPTSENYMIGNFWEFGKKWINKLMTWELPEKFVSLDPPLAVQNPAISLDDFERQLVNTVSNPFRNLLFRRLLADRDIVTEQDSNSLVIKGNGQGFTNVIQNYLNKSSRPRQIIEKDFLDELNFIFDPDAKFERILVRQHDNQHWELYLEEKDKGLVPLTNTGSGVKTILLILSFLNLAPQI